MDYKKAAAAVITAMLLPLVFASCSSTAQQAQATSTSVQESADTVWTSVSQQESTAADDAETSEESTTASDSTEKTGTTAATTGKGTTATTKKAASTTKKKSGKTTKKKKTSSTTKKGAATTTKAVANTTTQPTTQADKTIAIKLMKNGNAQCSSSSVTIDPPSGLQTEGTLYIQKAGDYVITSDTDEWHGQIIIELANTESASIRFENVKITSQKANVIKILDTSITAERSFIEADVSSGTAGGDTDNALRDEMKEVSKQDKAPNVDLSFPTGTVSSFSTGANSLSGVIYNESKLTIKGNGAVNITAAQNRNNAICSTKSITFKNVTATLTTAASGSTSALSSARGIFTFSKVYVESGALIIRSNGDGVRCEEYNSSGGRTDIVSSASDGIDADDAINITGGTVSVKGLEKSCFKVRRINNQEKINAGDKTVKATDGITKATHTFKIDGGTVVAEGKNITTVQTASKQASITCRSVKAASGSDEAKKAIKFTIKGTGVDVSSQDSCIKYLYSSAAINTSKAYTVSSSGYASVNVSFNGTVGDARIVASK